MNWSLASVGAGVVVGLLVVYTLLADRSRKTRGERSQSHFTGGKSCAMSAGCPARLHNTECQQCGLSDNRQRPVSKTPIPPEK